MLASSLRWSLPVVGVLALGANFALTACGDAESDGSAGGEAGAKGDPGSGATSAGDSGGTSSGSGASGSGAATGSGGSGAANGGGTGPCYDEPCSGRCVGSCAGGWTCETEVGCTADVRMYCSCDGETFSGSGSCAQLGYANEGECANPEPGSLNCDPADITCLPILPPEPCPQGQVRSVVNSCHGSCVPIDACACSSATECPNPDEFTCLNSAGHCSYYLR